MNIKTFVLTHLYRTSSNDTSVDVLIVASTMTKAKAELAKQKELILGDYEENNPDNYEVYENHPTYWGVSCKEEEVWDELQITEKEVDNDD